MFYVKLIHNNKLKKLIKISLNNKNIIYINVTRGIKT